MNRGVRSAESGTGSAMIRSRLSEADVQEIVKRFRHGTPKHKLATEYGMSLSTIKRLLKAIKGSKERI
jgi:DNA invertase Pin-like site-specific DNA recombinase